MKKTRNLTAGNKSEMISSILDLKKYCDSMPGCLNCIFVQESDTEGEVYCRIECPSAWDLSGLK